MKLRRIRSTLKGPITLFVIGMVLVVALLVLWNVKLAVDYQHIKELAAAAEQEGATFQWAFLTMGSVFFVAIIALFSILGAQLFHEIRLTQRLSTFVATFTHELNSPLASIKLFAQTLKREEDLPPEERDRFLGLILADVERLHGQLSNVLRAAQVDSPHGLQIAPERVDLRVYLKDYVEVRQAAAERLEADVTIALAGSKTTTEEVPALIDRQVFRQALDNLVDNALKYALGEGATRIELAVSSPSRETVRLEVCDNGSGIAKDDLKEIFDRFRRLEPKRIGIRKQQGTGLGLWIVNAIVDAHGGTVVADSEGPGHGTTIRIALPRAPTPSPEELDLQVAPTGEVAG